MVVSLVLITHTLFYSNKYSTLIIILGYILAAVSAVVHGLYAPQSKPKSTNLSEADLSPINPSNTYRKSSELIIRELMISNMPLKSPLSIQAYNELSTLLNKPIDTDIIYGQPYMINPEDKDYAIKGAMQNIIRESKQVSEDDYNNSMYQ